MLAPPIFPGRRQPSIVGRNELNYRVRNGNGWTLVLISTNYHYPGRPENELYYILQRGRCQEENLLLKNGDPYRIRTDVNGVRGRCLNHLTNGPGRRKLRSALSRHQPSAFGESSLRFVAPPFPPQTLCWFASDSHGKRRSRDTRLRTGTRSLERYL